TCRPQWALLNAYSLLCGYLGDEQAIGFYESKLPSCAPKQIGRLTIDEDIAEREKLWTPLRAGPHFRAAVPPSKIAEFAKAAALQTWIADAAFGILIGSHDPHAAARIDTAARAAGGSVTLFDGAGKPSVLSTDPNAKKIVERLKYAFDPDRRLNPLPVSE